MKRFKEFINEEFDFCETDDFDSLSDSDKIKKIIRFKCDINKLPEKLIIDGNLDCRGLSNKITELPNNLKVNGFVNLYKNNLTELPKGLIVTKDLNCGYNKLTSLPNDLIVCGDLNCKFNNLPSDTKKPIGVKGQMTI